MDKKKIELAIEKLKAISDFSNDLVEVLDELLGSDIKEAPPAKATTKKEKAKKDEPAPEPEETGEEEDITAEDVNEMSLDELKELAAENDLEIPKNIAKNVEKVRALVIETFFAEEEAEEPAEEPEEPAEADESEEDGELTEDDINEMSLADLIELAKENEVEVPKKIAKNVEKVRAFMIETFFTEDEEEPAEEEQEEDEGADESAEEGEDQVEISPERAEAEAKIEKDIKAKVASKKLTIKMMKDTLKKYYDGNADCKDCKGCNNDEITDCYIQLKQNFVDDDGEVMGEGEAYMRDDVAYCCGQECSENPDDENQVICEICGSKWDAE